MQAATNTTTEGADNTIISGAGQHLTSGLGHVLRHDEIDVSHGPILYLEDVNVSFDGFKALKSLSLSIDVGELRCVIGPNGAGKTTMMDVITGKTRAQSGKVFLGQTMDLRRMDEPTIARYVERMLGTGRQALSATEALADTVGA